MLQFLSLIPFLILLSGCGGSSPDNGAPESHLIESVKIPYECKSGNIIEASYPSNSTAVVEYEGQTLRMTIAISASGARYVGEGFVWWTKGTGPGSEGTLYRHENGDTTGELLEQCEQKNGA